ncbi:MAG: hypothetical protein IT260_22800 [Saprospiraceae bacterium]|nr:hypothetical protein [Saprospiraceae bacterium]
MRQVFQVAFSAGTQQWRVTAIVYAFQLCLALTLGMQVHSVLQASIGHSLEINALLKNYDHTVITDFLKVHGASITPLLGQLRWLLLVWLLFSVFIDGGLLVSATSSPAQQSTRSFWLGGAAHFFPFLKMALVFLALALVWTVVAWLPVALYLQSMLFYLPSETYSVWMLLGVLALYLAGLGMLLLWSVASRISYLKTKPGVFPSLRSGWTIFWQMKGRFSALLLVFVLLQLGLLALYWQLEAATGMTSALSILGMFLIQQAFVFFRIQLRQMLYAGIGVLIGRPAPANAGA